MNNSETNKKYWEKNIEGFAGFYDTKSEENIIGNKGMTFLYKKILFPIEKRFMFKRHALVLSYIDKYVKKGMRVADIGCGSGIYTKKMIDKGAFVYAFDYAESAINLTKRNLLPNELKFALIEKMDITSSNIPAVDLAISIGVLPYIEVLEKYLDNILPYTDRFIFNYLNCNNILNRIRKILKFLDVRKYSYHNYGEILREFGKQDYSIEEKTKLATGFLLNTKKIK